MSLAVKLQELRLKKNVSLQMVADAVDASKPHIWELEKGKSKNPSLELLTRLSKYYEVTLDYLTGKDNDELHARVQSFAREVIEKDLSEADMAFLKEMAGRLGKNNVD